VGPGPKNIEQMFDIKSEEERMANSAESQVGALTPDRFFAGFIAALRTISAEPEDSFSRLTASRVSLNRAFHRAMTSPAGSSFDEGALGLDFDPLYGVSPWFERALTRAQRDLLVGFPNPTYASVEIKLKKPQADRLLTLIGHRDDFIALAEAFLTNIEANAA